MKDGGCEHFAETELQASLKFKPTAATPQSRAVTAKFPLKYRLPTLFFSEAAEARLGLLWLGNQGREAATVSKRQPANTVHRRLTEGAPRC